MIGVLSVRSVRAVRSNLAKKRKDAIVVLVDTYLHLIYFPFRRSSVRNLRASFVAEKSRSELPARPE